jgi:repressor LexA
MKGTSKNQRVSDTQFIRFMRSYAHKHGYWPSIRDIMSGVGLNSTSAVSYRLRQLQAQGILSINRKKHSSRTYVLRNLDLSRTSGRPA